MKKVWADGWLVPVGIAVFLWGIAFSMACRVDPRAFQAGPDGGDDVLGQVLGASRVAFSESFFEEADRYFHKGAGHVQQKAFTNSVYQRLWAGIKPPMHEHAEGMQVKEIMPWLRFATQMDPNNVTAYLTTAYWLEAALDRPDLAESILLEAQSVNPRDYRVYDGRARLAFRQKDDTKAARLLDAAIRLWPSREDPEDEQVVSDKAQLLSRRAFLYELNGNSEKALELFREALRLNPQNRMLAKRVALMEQGVDFSEADRRTWESVFGGDVPEDHDHDDADHGTITTMR